MRLCDDNHDEVGFTCNLCPVCEARKEIGRHELYQEELLKANRELMVVVSLAVESQSWDPNDPSENQWTAFYAKARDAMRNGC